MIHELPASGPEHAWHHLSSTEGACRAYNHSPNIREMSAFYYVERAEQNSPGEPLEDGLGSLRLARCVVVSVS